MEPLLKTIVYLYTLSEQDCHPVSNFYTTHLWLLYSNVAYCISVYYIWMKYTLLQQHVCNHLETIYSVVLSTFTFAFVHASLFKQLSSNKPQVYTPP